MTDKIKYTEHYVAFLDILGFKNLVFSTEKTARKKIQKYFDITAKEIKRLQEKISKEPMQAIVISDSIILSFPAGKSNDEEIANLRSLCIAIRSVQYKLALEDIWLRGAISRGDAYFNQDTNQVVGQAYIKAYQLEEKYAKFPRVILDHNILQKLNFSSSSEFINIINEDKRIAAPEDEPNNPVLYKWKSFHTYNEGIKKDTPFFVDYLRQGFSNINELNKIVKHIEKNIFFDNAIYTKFRWVIDYLSTTGIHYKNTDARNSSEYGEIQKIITRLSKL